MAADNEKRRLQKRAFAMCNRAGVERSDRIELAKALLDLGEYDISSYNDLDADELGMLIFALRSWQVVEELRRINGAQFKQALDIVHEAYSELASERSAAEELAPASTTQGKRSAEPLLSGEAEHKGREKEALCPVQA